MAFRFRGPAGIDGAPPGCENGPAAAPPHGDREAGGYVVKTEGDAVFAAFAAPDGAVAAIVAAQRALASRPLIEGDALRVRAGLHLGVGRVRSDLAEGAPPDYVGIDVNYAARISTAANGGQIVLSEALVQALEGAIPSGASLIDAGLRRVKDFDEPARLYRLAVPGAAEDERPLRTLEAPSNLPHGSTSLIGRDAEIAQLSAMLAENRILTLSGPGGSGKTRLAIGVVEEARGKSRTAPGSWSSPTSASRSSSSLRSRRRSGSASHPVIRSARSSTRGCGIGKSSCCSTTSSSCSRPRPSRPPG